MVSSPPRFENILADQISYFAAQSGRATDFNPGSVIRTILEITAQIQERRDVAAWAALDQAMGAAVFDAWGFTRRDAVQATGELTLFQATASTSFVVRQGQQFRVSGSSIQVYEAVAPVTAGNSDWTISTGSVWTSNPSVASARITVRCVSSGIVGNVGPGQITESADFLANVAKITNAKAFTNGQEIATDAERRADFAAYVQALPRGTVGAVKYGAKLATIVDGFGQITERVAKVNLVEGTVATVTVGGVPAQTMPDGSSFAGGNVVLAAGQIAVFIHTGSTQPTQALISQTQNILDGYTDSNGVIQDGWRAAGVKCTVYDATAQNVGITGLNVLVASGYSLTQTVSLVKEAVFSLFRLLDVGSTLYLSDLIYFVKLVPGVLDATATITGHDGSGNLPATGPNYFPVLATIGSSTATQGNATQPITVP